MFHRSGSIFQFIIFPSPMILQKKLKKKKKKKKKNGFKYLEIGCKIVFLKFNLIDDNLSLLRYY